MSPFVDWGWIHASDVVSRMVLKFSILYGGCSPLVARLCSRRPYFGRPGRACLLWTLLRSKASCPGSKSAIDGTDGETSTQGLVGWPCKRSVYFLSPAQNLWRTIPQVVSDLSTLNEKLYCIFFLQIVLFLFLLEVFVLSLPVFSLCWRNWGLSTHGIRQFAESSHFLWRSVLTRNSGHGCTYRNNLLLWMAHGRIGGYHLGYCRMCELFQYISF